MKHVSAVDVLPTELVEVRFEETDGSYGVDVVTVPEAG